MKPWLVVLLVIAALLICFAIIHRRVIRAWIKHEPMPKAPKWHVWVKPEQRRK